MNEKDRAYTVIIERWIVPNYYTKLLKLIKNN